MSHTPIMALERRRPVVLFIHGFGSSPKCWAKLLELLRNDARITSRYDLETWGYDTGWFSANFLSRIPDLNEIGDALAGVLASPDYRDREVTLVGHSQGGLVIQSCFARLVSKEKAEVLSNVRQAIFMATPSEGSNTAISLRVLASSLIHNPQELKLRVLNPDMADMAAQIREQVIGATRDTASSHRVAMHAFCGMSDNVVPVASARGSFSNVVNVPGTHFSIITPKTRDDDRYKRFAELLLDPGGHPHRYEIEHYQTELRVEPRAQQVYRTKANNPCDVHYDNYATLKRTVRFAHANRCREPFTIKFGTLGGGCIIPQCSHENEAAPSVIEQWNDDNRFYQFDFTPKPEQDYCLNVEIYNGFGEGKRDIHFHLLHHSHYRRLTYSLDLSAYVAAGYDVTVGPSFYFESSDAKHDDICKRRKTFQPRPPTRKPKPGRYEWELTNVKQGIVDIVWDVAKQ
jgi:pimeloyl-ACP methyl ester carboxylesterase